MPSTGPVEPKVHFFDLSAAEFDAVAARWGWPKFRARQVREWVYGRYVGDPANMTNLSKGDRTTLADRVTFGSATVTRNSLSEDGTRKLLLTWEAAEKDEGGRLKDERAGEGLAPSEPLAEQGGRVGLQVLGTTPTAAARVVAQAECVMIPDGDRRTACVSSQVGCPVGCTFCASGIGGVKGNLTAGQIVEQIWWLNVLMSEGKKDEGGRMKDEGAAQRPPSASPLQRAGIKGGTKAGTAPANSSKQSTLDRISNVVFMGMGEPMSNYASVMKAIRILHEAEGFNIGARKITISTVGVPPKMRELAGEDLPINLAISLHAPTEPLRKQLIPWANHFALPDILDAARFYFDKTGREITLEYILLAGVNDRPEHAKQLARVCQTMRANVNLIRYNEVEGMPFKRPKSADVVAFQEILRRAGVNAHVRKSRGRDIDAACGQLRRKENAARGVGASAG
ncbi:MAG: 23S rRNA (adenine(2503)-C(2))-methyltransferase RlmN [Phycisphaerae bacterium]|nr:23S rRNA (adenine(2503)-C(2))-methyltransferase RlmN [Tepidisphaeraceae bacterium]